MQKLELPVLLKQAEKWSVETYLPALARGRSEPQELRAERG